MSGSIGVVNTKTNTNMLNKLTKTQEKGKFRKPINLYFYVNKIR